MSWVVMSLVLSIALTVVLNAGVRMFPHRSRRIGDQAERWLARTSEEPGPRVRVFFPWKAMLFVSIALTVIVNLVAALAR